MDGATKRHFSNVSGFWEEVEATRQLINEGESANNILKLTEDIVEVDWSEKQIKEVSDKRRFIFETYVEHQKRPGYQDDADLKPKFAEENFNEIDRTNGILIELQSNFQKLSNFTDAEFRHINLPLGGYSIQSLGKNLLLQRHASVGIGKGKKMLNTGSQTLSTDFNTKTLLIGGSFTGKIRINPYINSLSKKNLRSGQRYS